MMLSVFRQNRSPDAFYRHVSRTELCAFRAPHTYLSCIWNTPSIELVDRWVENRRDHKCSAAFMSSLLVVPYFGPDRPIWTRLCFSQTFWRFWRWFFWSGQWYFCGQGVDIYRACGVELVYSFVLNFGFAVSPCLDWKFVALSQRSFFQSFGRPGTDADENLKAAFWCLWLLFYPFYFVVILL